MIEYVYINIQVYDDYNMANLISQPLFQSTVADSCTEFDSIIENVSNQSQNILSKPATLLKVSRRKKCKLKEKHEI